MDATGHRWLAALSTFNFSLKYKSGKSNNDADGLSRRPHQNVELLPDIIQAVCSAYTVNRNNCPYVENLVITAAPEFVESMDSNIKASFGHVSEATDLSSVDWAKEQLKDPYVARLISLVDSGIFPQKDELKTEHPDVIKYLRHWKNLSLENGI